MTTFREFEQRGWQQAALRYHDAFASLTIQSIDPLLDAVRAGRGVRLLDLASGPGYAAGVAAARGASVIGVDFSSEMVDRARKGYPGIPFLEGDAEQLSLPDAAFDAVVMNYGMLHLGQPERAVTESWRVLRPGGRFAFTVWDVPERAVGFGIVLRAIQTHGNLNVQLPSGPPFFRFSDATESVRLLEDCGFSDPQVATIPQVWQLKDAGDLFDFMYNSSVRTAALLRSQTTDVLAAIQDSIRRDVESFRKNNVCELSMPAVLSSGLKPLAVS
jgi:ubiquinone/menaquinone biosynthesis C-methylase UbiE